MNDVSEEGVNALLDFLYRKNLDENKMSEETTFELLHTAHKYDIKSLEQEMVKLLNDKPQTWFTLTNVLSVYFFTVKVEEYQALCNKMMVILKR